jgi:hypothetical protein
MASRRKIVARAASLNFDRDHGEAGRSIHGVEGDQAEHRDDYSLIADKATEHARRGRRLSRKSEPDDFVRLGGAITRGVKPEDLHTLAVAAETFELRKKLEELEKEATKIKVDLSDKEKWLGERLSRHLSDPRPTAPILSTPNSSPADERGAPAGLAQEPPANGPSEPLGLLGNSGQRSPGRAPRVNPEIPEVVTKADHVEPSTAPDPRPSPIRSAAQIQDSERDRRYQQLRVEWALKRLYPDEVPPPGLGVANITREIGRKLTSQEAREAAMSDGGTPSWNTVDRALKRLGLR